MPRFGVTMAAIIRDEALYLAEWIEYHTLLGVEHVYLYDNGSTDRPVEVLHAYIVQGRVTLVAWPEYPGQEAAYNHALKVFGRDSAWMVLIDIDEFVRLPPDRTVPMFLAAFGDGIDQVLMPWVHFGASGHERRPDGLVIESYVHRVAEPHRQPKSIVRPEAVTWAEVHHCVTRAGRTVDVSGRAAAEAWRLHAPAMGNAWIAHYFTKSRAEFAAKIARGQADAGRGKTLADFARFDTPVEDRSLAALAPAVRVGLMATAAARDTTRHVHAARSAASELAHSRAWLLAGKAAMLRLASRLGIEDARVRIAPDRLSLAGVRVDPVETTDTTVAIQNALDAVSVAHLDGVYRAGETRIAVAEARLGRPFLAATVSATRDDVLTVSVHGRDGGEKPWREQLGLSVPSPGMFALAILSARTMTVEEIVVTSRHGPQRVVGGVFSFI